VCQLSIVDAASVEVDGIGIVEEETAADERRSEMHGKGQSVGAATPPRTNWIFGKTICEATPP